jgi:hypothetical protein
VGFEYFNNKKALSDVTHVRCLVRQTEYQSIVLASLSIMYYINYKKKISGANKQMERTETSAAMKTRTRLMHFSPH